MKQHVCWDAQFVESVVGNGVEESARGSLLSRHVPVRLHRADKDGNVDDVSQPWTEDEFFEKFLASNQKSVVAGVIGEAGQGKTHFVRWVEAKLQQSKREGRNCRVIRIPRLKTSLPGVLERLVAEVPETHRHRFANLQEKLRDYRESGADAADLRFELAQKLILRLRERKFEREGISPSYLRIIDHLIERQKLHTLFQAPAVNDWLCRDGGEIDAVVRNNLLHREEEEVAPDDRGFQSVPLGDWMLEPPPKGLRGGAEFEHLRPLRNQEQEFVRLLNAGLTAAVKDFLSERFSLESAEHTLVEIRKAIHDADPGAEIILLIQDLARTKYAEDELIKACTADEQEGEPMAPMRTLFATTTSLYSGMQASTRQRVGLLGIAGHEWSIMEAPELQFASRYMEVFRAGGSGDSAADEPSCQVCSHTDAREAFGEIGGNGLYPFTPYLLRHLACQTRVRGRFHPRSFLVAMAGDLQRAASAIPQGAHPARGFAMVEHIEEQHLDGQQYVQSLGFAGEVQSRALRALDGYGQGEGLSRRVPAFVVAAFCLPEEIASAHTANPSKPSPTKAPVPAPPKPEGAVPAIKFLPDVEQWVAAKQVLLGDADMGMALAAFKQLVGPIAWELHGTPPLIRNRTLAWRSIVFKGAKRTKDQGMRQLQVTVEVPLVAEAEKVKFRRPWMRAYLMEWHENGVERVGWNEGASPSGFEEYGLLADAQDALEHEILRQVEGVLGSREQQMAWALRSVVSDAFSAGERLPERLDVQPLLRWLEGMARVAGNDNAVEVLRYLGSWKEGGDAFMADGYHVAQAIAALRDIEAEVPRPQEILETQGRELNKMLDAAMLVASLISSKRQELRQLSRELGACMERHFGGDAAVPHELGELSKAIGVLAIDLEKCGGTDVRPYRQLSGSLTDIDHASLVRLKAVDDDTYEGLAVVLDAGLKMTAESLMTRMKEADTLLDRARRLISEQQRPGGDVSTARREAIGKLDELMNELADLGGALL